MTAIDRLRTRSAVDVPVMLCAVAAVVVIALQADLRTPLQLPGHRGVLWLGALVAVALLARRRGVVTATGAASAAVSLGLGLAPNGVFGVLPFVLAAVALDGLMAVAAVRARPWLVVVLAAPVHLVALVTPFARGLRVGVTPAAMLPGMATVAVWHLAFGLVAGLAGWFVFRSVRRISR